MQCLHTAMFSTLAAVIWIMVIVPLIISPWMKKMKRIENPICHAPPDEEGDIDIDSLLREIHQVEVNVRQITECVSMFNQNLTAASKEL